MKDVRRGRLLSSAGIGVAALVPAAGLAVLAAQVNTAGYVLPAAVNTLSGPTSAPSLPTSSPPGPATVADPPVEVLTAPRSAVADVHRADAAYARTAAGATGGDIPAVAIAAYMRAATVINAADKNCHLDWELLAAIGRVESNHGRFAGSALDSDGVATPPILGLRLDGSHGTTKIADTDAGEYDGDRRFDRAVGPMQFIPSTWSYVGVDADGDGKRDPQDIQDASLGSAVYLCVGKGDLSTVAGQRAAVYRYNHSQRYVDLVLSIAKNYQAGSLWSANGAGSPTTTVTTVTTTGSGAGGDPLNNSPVLVRMAQIVILQDLPDVGDVPGHGSSGSGSDPTDPAPGDDPSEPGDDSGPTQPGQPGDPTEEPSGPTTPGPHPPPSSPSPDPAPSPDPSPDPSPSDPGPTDPTPSPSESPGPSVATRAEELCLDTTISTAADMAVCQEIAADLIRQSPDGTVSMADLVARLEEAGVTLP